MPLPTSSVFPPASASFAKFASRRSVVHSTEGIVACTQPLAAKCGLEVLRAGGNAAVRSCSSLTWPPKHAEYDYRLTSSTGCCRCCWYVASYSSHRPKKTCHVYTWTKFTNSHAPAAGANAPLRCGRFGYPRPVATSHSTGWAARQSSATPPTGWSSRLYDAR